MSAKLDQELVVNRFEWAGIGWSASLDKDGELFITLDPFGEELPARINRSEAIAIIQHLKQVFNLTEEELINSEQ